MTINRIKKFLDAGYCQCDKPAESIPSAGKPQVCVICDKPIIKKNGIQLFIVGMWIKENGSELKIKIAWKDGFLHFKPLSDGEKSL